MTSIDQARQGQRRYEIAAVGLVMLLIACYFAYASFWSYLRQWQAHSSFLPVSATVLEVSVQSWGSAATTHGESFFPHVVYRYSVAGSVYESDRYFFAGTGWSDRSAAEAAIAGLQAGSLVQAYVDADNPSRAVLDRSKPEPGVLLYAGPFGLLALGTVIYGLRRRRET